MSELTEAQWRLLSVAEREMVELTMPPAVDTRSDADLLDIIKRLRSLRDRANRIARQQKRVIRGKDDPRGATPVNENAGSAEKADIIAAALQRATDARRKQVNPAQAEIARKALAMKKLAGGEHHPDGGPTASRGMKAKTSKTRTVRMDPREIGRVSQATKNAQARKDSKGGH